MTESAQLLKFIQDRRAINHPNIPKIPYYEVSEEQRLTTTFYRHLMGFEFHQKTLEKELFQRS